MCHALLYDSRFFALLLKIDQDQAMQVHAGGCVCAGRLHRANYPRKPRGCLPELRTSFEQRLSFCCSQCRKRCTPGSVRFLGRRVYLALVVVLRSNRSTAPLPAELAVPRLTLERWRLWWQTAFTQTSLWQASCGLFMPPVDADGMPVNLLERFIAVAAADRLMNLLRFLRPLTSRSADPPCPARNRRSSVRVEQRARKDVDGHGARASVVFNPSSITTFVMLNWGNHLNSNHAISRRSGHARLRFSIIGALLAAPPAKGELLPALRLLAAKLWRDPVTGLDVCFGLSTVERWYYVARRAQDPVAMLTDRLRSTVGLFPSLSALAESTLITQYRQHPGWTVQLHDDKLAVALASAGSASTALPSYPTVRRIWLLQGSQGPQASRHGAPARPQAGH